MGPILWELNLYWNWWIMTFYFLTALIAVLDRLSKMWAVSTLKVGPDIRIIDGVFHLSYLENKGVAFGMLSALNPILPFISVAIVIGIFYYYKKSQNRSLPFTIGLAFICGGALGNIIDRFVQSYVVDFISVYIFGHPFPIFNVADIFVTCGSFILLIYFIISDKKAVEGGFDHDGQDRQ